MKKNNTAQKTILDAEKLAQALKEGTEKTLRDIVSESISNLVMESEDDEEEKEDDSYDVEDVNTEETPVEAPESTEDNGEEEVADETGEDDEWGDDLEQYKVGDDDYDFTGVEGDEVIKVFNKLGDDDQIFVKKEDDGTYSVKDDETGAEFVIELDPDALGSDAESDDAEDFDDDQEFEVDFDDDEEGDLDDDAEIDVDFGEGDGDEDIEIDLGDDDEDELNEENLGYTDSYQKDVFDKKFNMSEPADSKTTNDWDNGVPKGSEKPWAGKGDGQPFDKKVNECPVAPEDVVNEAGDTNAQQPVRKTTKSKYGQHRPNGPAQVKKVDSEDAEVQNISETIKKVIAKARQIQAENKKYDGYISRIKKSLYEAATLNVNMGKLIDILVNETTTKDEKKRICERFNNVKTIAEGKNLYETIKSELKEAKSVPSTLEKQFVAESKNLNETTIYQNTAANNPSINLMERMDNLYVKKK